MSPSVGRSQGIGSLLAKLGFLLALLLLIADSLTSLLVFMLPGYSQRNALILWIANYTGMLWAILISKMLVCAAFLYAYKVFLNSERYGHFPYFRVHAILFLVCAFYIHLIASNYFRIFH